MANKYDLINNIFTEQISEVTRNQKNWTSFLKTAANNYKYSFIDQILIHAQRPDATACAEIGFWNEKFGRWVNKGANGIALFDYSATYPKLRYVFDVSDTNSYYGNDIELWSVPKRYEEEVKEALSNAFGETAGGSLEAVIDDIAQKMAVDNAVDYISTVDDLKLGSFLEELDTHNIEMLFKSALANSIGYMMMTRCGINADDFYDMSDFKEVMNFNTSPVVISFGVAVSEVAEMGLREIESTVRNLQKNERKRIRTFDKQKEIGYDEGVKEKHTTERSNDNDTDNLQTSGRLQYSQPDTSERGNETAEQIRYDEKDISSESQESSLGNPDFTGQADEPSLRDSATGSFNGTAYNREADEGKRSDRGNESDRSDEVGADYEQHSELGTGNGTERSDLRISDHDFNGGGSGIDYFHQNKEKNELIKTYLAPYKEEIAEFFEVHSDRDERSDFILSLFNSEPFEMTLSNGIKAGFEAYSDAIRFWRADRDNSEREAWERWFQVSNSVYGMILIEEWTEPQALLLPSADNQKALIESKAMAGQLYLPQAAVDYILARGSGISEGKMRIYRQFQKSLSKDDNVRFLRNEYGTGGHSDAIPGTGYWENHDAKGIEIQDCYSEPKRKILFSWAQIEKRISDLISLDRYLNPKEKEAYPQWLEKQEQRRIENALEAERRKILQTAPPEPKEYEYHFSLGDTVYIGADEYTISSLSDPVILNDSKFPLFTKEFAKSDFVQKVKENPSNNYLRVEVQKATVTETEEQTNDIVDELYGDDEPDSGKQTTDNSIWDDYSKIKTENPDSIVFYQLGDFFEVMGEDANIASEALDIILTSRRISDTEKVQICGIPSHKLETYLGMMNDRGFDVTLSTFENGERQNRLVVSQNKEDPTNSFPIGRIEYLNENGDVARNIEYTSRYQFVKDITEEASFGVRFRFYLYRDKEGKTIDQGFISKLDTPLNVYEIIDSPYISQSEEFTDKDLIGKEITIDDRKYVIESIGEISGDVSMRDVTFQNNVGFPINRIERIGYVRKIYRQQKTVDLTQSWEQPQPKTELLKPTVPESEKHNYKITDDNLGVGGAKEKFRNNMAAIILLHDLEFENRLATSEEQEVLAKYVGFGGLADAFDETKQNWSEEFTELYTALSPEEYSAARESTLTAFYTPPIVIKSIYQALENMGFKTGNILEPSCGVGNFMGMLPDSMKDSKFYGVELDSLTGRIAQQLYQKANIAVQGYETTALPDSFFDVAIGNVPFGQFKVSDKKYDKNNWLIHDYFFGKTLDKVRSGGVIAFITSSGTMDKKNPNVRKYIAQRAELLGAIRLPDNTFKANAGTDVVSDILFLQKRDTLTNEEPSWVHLCIDENGYEINQYFIDNPDMVLGELTVESLQYGQKLTCKAYDDVPLENLLNDAIQSIHADFSELELSEIGEEESNYLPADPNVRNFSYTLAEGKVYYRENSRMNEVDVSETAKNRIKGMIEIRDCVRTLIDLQTEDYPDSTIKVEQERLNTLYDSFTKKYGLINSRANNSAFSSDSSYYLLCSLEVIGENGELKRKADMFTKRTIRPNVKVSVVATASEALAVSIGEKAYVDMDFMQELTGKTEQELYEDLKGVIFINPEADSEHDTYLTADEYLSGNVRKKLEVARRYAEGSHDEYTVNVEALEKVQPEELSASEISVRLGATWLPTEDVQQFMFELLQTPRYAQWNIKVHYSHLTAEWNIENKSYDRSNVMANSTYGTDRINAYKIIEETLNLKDVRIFDYIEDKYGNKKPVLNKKETAIAQGKQELIKQAFQDWIWKDPSRRQRLVKLYNERFNSMRAREYDGSHITFSGMNHEITLRPHQINAVARIMYGGNTLLAHVVGAGKSATRS